MGIIFDEKLTRTSHIDELKIVSCLNKIIVKKKLAHTFYGADRTSLLHIYRTPICLKCDYGAEIYCCTPHYNQTATGAFRTFLTISLLWKRRANGLCVSNANITQISSQYILSVRKLQLQKFYQQTATFWNLPIFRLMLHCAVD